MRLAQPAGPSPHCRVEPQRRRAQEDDRGDRRQRHDDEEEQEDRHEGHPLGGDEDVRPEDHAVDGGVVLEHRADQVRALALEHPPVRAPDVADEEPVRRLRLLGGEEVEDPPPEAQGEQALGHEEHEHRAAEPREHLPGPRDPQRVAHRSQDGVLVGPSGQLLHQQQERAEPEELERGEDHGADQGQDQPAPGVPGEQHARAGRQIRPRHPVDEGDEAHGCTWFVVIRPPR